MKARERFLIFGLVIFHSIVCFAQSTIINENFDNFSSWSPSPDNGAGCEWTAENGWAKIKTMGTNPFSHIFAKYEYDLPLAISPDEDFSFKAYFRCQDGDPSGSTSNTYIELMNSNYERVAMLMWDDSQASSGHGGLTFAHGGGSFYDNDPNGFGTHNPTIDNELEIRREGTTWTAYLDGVQLGSPVSYYGDKTATKLVIITNKYRHYGQRDGRIDYISIEKYVDITNQPPVAKCKDIVVSANNNCEASVDPIEVDNGSFDPDDDPIILSLTPPGPYPLGNTPVTLTVSDGELTDICTATITVVDDTPPEVTAALVPVNGGDDDDDDGNVFEVQCSATDNCDSAPSVSSVIVTPSLTNPSVKFKTSNKKKLTFNLKKNKITVRGPDSAAFWAQVQADGGVAVSNGQRVRLSGDDDDDDDSNKVTYHFDQTGNLRSQKGDNTLTLRCTSTDASGNTATAEATATALGDDNDEDEADKAIAEVTTTESSLLNSYDLLQNHPNPFNPSTTITFAVPEAGEVTLAIYNLQGQLIRTLQAGPVAAGRHQVIWNGTGSRGVKVTSGMYVYQLRAKDFVATKRLVLLK